MKQKPLYISSSSIPLSLLLAVLMICAIESFIATHIDYIIDQSALCIRYKLREMTHRPTDDVVIFGTSRSMSIDAVKLEKACGNKLSVFNYSLPNFETTIQFYYTMKRFLYQRYKAPKLMLLSVPQEMYTGYLVNDQLEGVRFEGFRRFFDAWFMALNIENKADLPILKSYDWRNAIPSFNFRTIFLIHHNKGRLLPWKLVPIINRNRELLNRLRMTNGQMLYNADKELNPRDSNLGLPPDIKTVKENIRPNTNIEKCIQLAHELKIPLVMFDTPMPEKRYKRMEYLQYFDLIKFEMKRFEKKYPGFKYYTIKQMYLPYDCFGDRTHLNNKGAATFNKSFKEDFQKIIKQEKTVEAKLKDEHRQDNYIIPDEMPQPQDMEQPEQPDQQQVPDADLD